MTGQEKKNSNQNGGVDNNEVEPAAQNEEDNVAEEYYTLDMKLDELSSALDYLEQKNDDIHERLMELLQSNRNIRRELQSENKESTGNN